MTIADYNHFLGLRTFTINLTAKSLLPREPQANSKFGAFTDTHKADKNDVFILMIQHRFLPVRCLSHLLLVDKAELESLLN